MLNVLVQTQMKARRLIVLRHPNRVSCQVLRKVLQREAPTEMGGIPTLGGLGVLESDDEDQFEYLFVGNGVALPAGDDPRVSSLMGHRDAASGEGAEFRFMIEPEEPADPMVAPGFAPPGGAPDPILKKSDVVYLVFMTGVRLAYEVVDIESTSGLHPFAPRYVLIRRDHLDIVGQ